MAQPLIFLTAGEPSGDYLGARLMTALKARTGGAVRFVGVGGERMAAEGLTSLFPMSDLSVFGLAEVLPKLPLIRRRIRETALAARDLSPDVMVMIDAQGFSLRVARRLQGRCFPLIQYVAPTVWAWRPWRARTLARSLDHILTLFPFEPPYFEAEGLPASFVGHPVLESGIDRGDGAGFRTRHGLPATAPLLAVLPGSRTGEVTRLLPVYRETVARLAADRPDLRFAVPTVPAVAALVRDAVADWSVPVTLVVGDDEKRDLFAAADAALAASGTVTLELGLAGVPMVVAYRLSALSAAIGRRLVRVRYACLINLALDRMAVPERLQEACTPDRLVAELAPLLDSADAAARQRADLMEALRRLGHGGPSPSDRAAAAVLRCLADAPARPSREA